MTEETQLVEMLTRYVGGDCTPEEVRELSARLEHDPAACDLLAEILTQGVAVREFAQAHPGPVQKTNRMPQPWLSWLAWRPLTAAAAGLLFGLCSASLLFAYAAPRSGAVKQRVVSLFSEGFEKGEQPGVRGMPAVVGVWGGDHARIVAAEQGVVPHGGGKMLRLLRSDFEGEQTVRSSSSGQVRVFDLSAHEAVVAAGGATLKVASWFKVVPSAANEEFACSVVIHAFADDPTRHSSRPWDAWLMDETLALRARSQALPAAAGSDWLPLSARLRLPSDTRYVTVHVKIKRTDAAATAPLVEFAGAYVDDVTVELSAPESR